MKILSQIFAVIILAAPTAAAFTQPARECGTNRAALKARLGKTDCAAFTREASSFLAKNRDHVQDFSRLLKSGRLQIVELANELEARSQTAMDCFVKHRGENDMGQVHFKLMKITNGIQFWSDKPEAPKQVQEILIKDYDEAIDTISAASKKW